MGRRKRRAEQIGKTKARRAGGPQEGATMTKRTRKTDAHVATVRISIPIDAQDIASITGARDAIASLATKLPSGSAVEILSSRFGRVELPAEPPKQAELPVQPNGIAGGGALIH